MSVRENLYNNVSGGTSYVTISFTNSVLTQDPSDPAQKYYISFVPYTRARDTGNNVMPTKVATGLDDLALTGANVAAAKQSSANISDDYTSINNLVADYLYDYINGHTADQFGTGVTTQLPLDF